MNTITGNYEIVTFFVVLILIWLVVTGRVESVIKTITGPKDKQDQPGTNTNDPYYPKFGPPTTGTV